MKMHNKILHWHYMNCGLKKNYILYHLPRISNKKVEFIIQKYKKKMHFKRFYKLVYDDI